MCLYPRRIINKKYTATQKNEYVTPIITNGVPEIGHAIPTPPIIGYTEHGMAIYDDRVNYVLVGCGKCIECRKQKALEWQCRLNEELKVTKYPYFITLTFSPEQLDKLCNETNLKECNAVAGKAVRRHLELWRKHHGKSLKHWYITELGHEGTERIHMHGLILSEKPLQYKEITRCGDGVMAEWKYWKYGNIFIGDYCSEKSINYISKYINKIDTDHKGFEGQILCSPGIGKNWLETHQNDPSYNYIPGRTRSDYRLNNGARIKLPTYYRNKIRTEEERENIWREFMDSGKISIMGMQHQNLTHQDETNIVQKAQEQNTFLGYGNDDPTWKKVEYNVTERMRRSEAMKKMNEQLDKISKFIEVF